MMLLQQSHKEKVTSVFVSEFTEHKTDSIILYYLLHSYLEGRQSKVPYSKNIFISELLFLNKKGERRELLKEKNSQ